ncbi:hypothetical protein LCGC14_1846060 [marine sediment metagenome]|uniref:N-acetyltransferase domain-containing protein n=1 Tax=marine sediment metagenome TaxID=412755 RepID=A0A0F9IRG0_9ZZZZ
MAIEIREVGSDSLDQYGQIPMRHRVESIFRVDEIDGGFGGLSLTETPFDQPYVKDHDGDPEENVSSWTGRFDVSNWLFLMAFDGDKAVGGATLAFRSPKVNMLQGRNDLAVLWDIRVHPDYKRQGLGSRLIDRAVEWARKQGCKQLKIETQNNNVPACRFYAARGCHLGAIDRYGYAHDPRFAHEAMLIWYLDL